MTKSFVLTCLAGLVTAAGASSALAQSKSGSWGQEVPGLTAELRVRKDVKDLTKLERFRFVLALHLLKHIPSPYDPSLSYYDQFVAWHIRLHDCDPYGTDAHPPGHMQMAHGGPMYLPWHREYVLLLEDALREVAGPKVTVPYWDFTDPESTASTFRGDFMGGSGDPDDGYVVKTGPFRAGAWPLNVNPVGIPYGPSASAYLTRRFGDGEFGNRLPNSEEVAEALARPVFDVAPYSPASDITQSFRNYVEGFRGDSGVTCVPQPDGTGIMAFVVVRGPEHTPKMHNAVHRWVGGDLGLDDAGGPVFGTMMTPASPNDPVFFLLHSNVDRLWAEWQESHGIDTYAPVSGYPHNNVDDVMTPFAEYGIISTPASVADIRKLGYRYE
jgi:tyrosinase